jgi:7,8-dihydropterin-6-yl-methyl-4-(beta-D-ribofuranosyl)aminobenzene 5'-phosphate synthase
MKHYKISVLVENRASQTFLGEHGLSFIIKSDHANILFDTGQGKVIEHNLKVMNFSPERINSMVLSHGHYDHTGGIEYLSKHLSPEIKVYLHPSALEEKYSKISTGYKFLGISEKNRDYLKSLGENLILTSEPTEIADGIWCTGEIPRTNPIENRSTKFYLDKSTKIPDTMLDDQALFFHTEKGVVVLLGCCHAGFANTLDYIAKIADAKTIYAVIGGTHLRNANFAQLDFTAATLAKYNVKLFAPCHCSGPKSSAYLYAENREVFQECHAGASFLF